MVFLPVNDQAASLTGIDFLLFAALRTCGVAMHWFRPRHAHLAAGTRRLLGLPNTGRRTASSPCKQGHDDSGTNSNPTITLGVNNHQVWIDHPDNPDRSTHT